MRTGGVGLRRGWSRRELRAATSWVAAALNSGLPVSSRDEGLPSGEWELGLSTGATPRGWFSVTATAREPAAPSHLPTQATLTLLLEAHPVRGLGYPDTLDGLQGAARRSRISEAWSPTPGPPHPPPSCPPHLPCGTMGPSRGGAGSPSSACTIMHTDWESDSRW